MPLYNKIIDDTLKKDKELGTIGSETMSNLGEWAGTQYEKLPENFRTGLEEGTADNLQAIQEWNIQKREENVWGGIGPLDPFIQAGKVYNTIATPIKEQLSIKTGLAPSVIEGGEIIADVVTPFIPLAATKTTKLLNVVDNIPSTTKRVGKSIATTLTPDPLTQANIISDFYTIKSDTKKLLDNIGLGLSNNQPLTPAYASVSTGGPVRNIINDADILSSAKPLQSRGGHRQATQMQSPIPTADKPVPRGAGYKKQTLYGKIIDADGIKIADSTTDVHHVGELITGHKAAVTHKSWKKIPEGGRSPIFKLAESKYGLRGGNALENLTDIFGHDPRKLRQYRIQEINKQLNGKMHETTVNDLLGTSDLKFKEAVNLESLESQALHQLQTTKGIYPGSKGAELYPKITIKNTKGEVIEIWQPKTQKDYDRRFNIVRKKLGIKEKLNLKKIKIDPTKEVLGVDHTDAHRIVNKFKRLDDGNPMNTLYKSMESGEYANLSVEKATELYVDAYRFQENVTGHILQYRYEKAKEVFAKYYPDVDFEHLSKARQQDFFRNKAAEIAVKGGIEKRVSMELAKTPLKNWSKNMTNVFGWKPQLIK